MTFDFEELGASERFKALCARVDLTQRIAVNVGFVYVICYFVLDAQEIVPRELQDLLGDFMLFGLAPLFTISTLIKFLLGNGLPSKVEMLIGSPGILVISEAETKDSNSEKGRLIRWEDISKVIVFGSNETTTSVVRLHTYRHGPIWMRCCLGFASRAELSTRLSARFIVEPPWRYWVSAKGPDVNSHRLWIMLLSFMGFSIGASILGIDPKTYEPAAIAMIMGTLLLVFVAVALSASQNLRRTFLLSWRVKIGTILAAWTFLSIYLVNAPYSNALTWILATGIALSAVDLIALVLRRKSIWAAASGCPWLANTERELLFMIDGVLIAPAVLALIAVIAAT